MISPIQKGCTRVLDAEIAEQRRLYAAEREDFHSFFPEETVRNIQRILREKRRRYEVPETRRNTVQELLHAQKTSPHTLWTLLLLQAFEGDLVRRRRALSTGEGAVLDHLVVETFLGALEDIPHSLYEEDIKSHVLKTWRKALDKEIRRQRRSAPKTPPPRPSGVTVIGTDAAEGPGTRQPHAAPHDAKGRL
jgi:hypothetical protein